MKKIFLVFACLVFSLPVFAQTNTTVRIDDEVYAFLTLAESKGYCTALYSSKPYTESYILMKLDEISESISGEISKQDDEPSFVLKNELNIVEFQKTRFVHKDGFDFSKLAYKIGNDSIPFTFIIDQGFEGLLSSGIYTNKKLNSTGYEFFYDINFTGDLLKYLSYSIEGFLGVTKMPLAKVGSDYDIGKWWFDTDPNDPGYNVTRTINTYKNYAVLPYSYKKFWDGSAYFFKNLSASGLEGWSFEHALAFGMKGDLRASLADNKIEIGMGREDREWAGMDNGSSLVLNSMARPFLAFDFRIRPLSVLTFSTLTGVLEFPNQLYITENAWNYQKLYMHAGKSDAYYFQNAFSIIMMDLDFKYFHFDFGSASVWPKRFEFGYMFPFIDNVIYQNNVGDYDNLALFADMKFILPGIASAWVSGYLDEMPRFKFKELFKLTRYMFALQAGTKVVMPFLPFTTLSFRYTKVEPYCYTHHSINNTPWYNHYISESYTNNGSSLGYYLPPNSDEFHLRFESTPSVYSTFALQGQLIRHGANFGSRQVRGSDLYSELPNKNRDQYLKFFLRDGCYEWTFVVSASASYNFNQFKVPVTFDFTAGFVYDWFTDTGAEQYTWGSYRAINTSEYSTSKGVILNAGIKLWF